MHRLRPYSRPRRTVDTRVASIFAQFSLDSMLDPHTASVEDRTHHRVIRRFSESPQFFGLLSAGPDDPALATGVSPVTAAGGSAAARGTSARSSSGSLCCL